MGVVRVLTTLYCCRFGVQNSKAETLVTFVDMLHLPTLSTEDMKPGNDLDFWSLMGFPVLLTLASLRQGEVIELTMSSKISFC